MPVEADWDSEGFKTAQRAFALNFQRESWVWFTITAIVALIRYYTRWRRFGFRGARLDDGLMILAFATFTTMICGINHLMLGGAESSFMSSEAFEQVDAPLLAKIIDNGHWMFAIKHLNLFTVFLAKFCLLIVYLRVTEGLQVRKFIVVATIYTVACLVIAEIILIFTCFPIHRRWTPPNQDRNCAFYDSYQIGEGVLSVTSSVLILGSGLPVILQVRLPPRQKWIIVVLFGLGLFDITASILTKVYSTVSKTGGFVFYSWFLRECAVALLVCNLPFVWSLLCDAFPSVSAWSTKTSIQSNPRFWKEPLGRKRSIFGCMGYRRSSDTDNILSMPELPKPVHSKASNDQYKYPTQRAAYGVEEDPIKRRMSEKVDAAVIDRMVGGELEDELYVSMADLHDPQVFEDIDEAVTRKQGLRCKSRFAGKPLPDPPNSSIA